MKKILIAIPTMDMVPMGFAQSLAMLNKVGECVVSSVVGSLIYDARNKLAAEAVKLEADYVMWFDSDMIFQADTLERLMKDLDDGKDIVSGLYFRRSAPFSPVAFEKVNISSDVCDFKDYHGALTGIHEVEGVGFGCVLMRSDILFECFSKYGTCFSPIGAVGEDLSFCWRARELGYKIYLDADIKLGHVGHLIVTEAAYRSLHDGGES